MPAFLFFYFLLPGKCSAFSGRENLQVCDREGKRKRYGVYNRTLLNSILFILFCLQEKRTKTYH